MGVGELDLGRRGQRQRCRVGGMEGDPAVAAADLPAPDHVTSPEASSSSSIAGW